MLRGFQNSTSDDLNSKLSTVFFCLNAAVDKSPPYIFSLPLPKGASETATPDALLLHHQDQEQLLLLLLMGATCTLALPYTMPNHNCPWPPSCALVISCFPCPSKFLQPPIHPGSPRSW